MPHTSGSHLEGDFMRACELAHISMLEDDRQPQALGRAPNQKFVRITAAATEFVIEMSDCEWPTPLLGKSVQHGEQHHRITATGDRNQNILAPGQKPMLADGSVNVFE